ncbi:glycosyltransferase family 2 protein [Pedobacter psychroterrae]|uniref:Glycosyltransferase n=1 Tax=Pedobacter psychroterrae TaxID=2530453 RepID=A0A4R0NNZ8_9SPHI|nr:glycosyltransferase [Pedobacter psychroterrae]TCD02682.1 glycosyltransferase [Pedobacter psychroterrae]
MEKEMPLVSIVSGYYNRVNFVDESVSSLINQTYQNIEILIFDDCSKDGTYEKLKAFEQIDSRLRVIRHENNKGFVRGMIDAVAIAKGEFIAVHGSGDISLQDRVSEQVAALINDPTLGAVGCHYENVKIDAANPVSHAKSKIVRRDFSGNAQQTLTKENIFTHGEVMFRKATYEQAGGYRELFKFAQDRDLWCRMSMISDFYIVPKQLYKRFSLPDGASVVVEKRVVQKVLAEFAVQNHELRLAGKPDLIKIYGNQALIFFKYTDRFIRNIYPVIIGGYMEHNNKPNPIVLGIVKQVTSRYFLNRFSIMLYLLYFVLPENVGKYIGRKRNW